MAELENTNHQNKLPEDQSISVPVSRHEAAEHAVDAINMLPASELVRLIENTPGLIEQLTALTIKKQSHLEISHGPIPPPGMLADYNNAVPNGASIIMSMAEKEQEQAHWENNRSHRRADIDLYFIHGLRAAGLIFALAITCGWLLIVYKLAMSNHDIAASIFGVSGMAAIVKIFITGTSSQKSTKDHPDDKKEDK